jgi:hypothetical protein
MDYLKAGLVVAAGVAIGNVVSSILWTGIVRLIVGPVLE